MSIRSSRSASALLGEIKDRIGNYLVIWGVAIPQDGDFTKMGTVVSEGNIEVSEADPEAIYSGTYGYRKEVEMDDYPASTNIYEQTISPSM